MQKISDYFKKFQKIGFLHFQNKEVVKRVLVGFFGEKVVNLIKFEIKGKTIKIFAPNTIRSEIFLRKEEVLEEINKKGETNFLEIK